MRLHKFGIIVLLSSLLASCGQMSSNVPQKQSSSQGSATLISQSPDSYTYKTADGVEITFNNFKSFQDNSSVKNPNSKIGPQQAITVLTYVSSSESWFGSLKYVTSLHNYNTSVSVTLSTTVSDSATGSISGGIDSNGITASVGYTGTYSTSSTVTTNPVSPGGTVYIYSKPGGTKYYGYQRTAPVGYSWYQCNVNPQYCGSLSSWSAIKVTGIGFQVQ